MQSYSESAAAPERSGPLYDPGCPTTGCRLLGKGEPLPDSDSERAAFHQHLSQLQQSSGQQSWAAGSYEVSSEPAVASFKHAYNGRELVSSLADWRPRTRCDLWLCAERHACAVCYDLHRPAGLLRVCCVVRDKASLQLRPGAARRVSNIVLVRRQQTRHGHRRAPACLAEVLFFVRVERGGETLRLAFCITWLATCRHPAGAELFSADQSPQHLQQRLVHLDCVERKLVTRQRPASQATARQPAQPPMLWGVPYNKTSGMR